MTTIYQIQITSFDNNNNITSNQILDTQFNSLDSCNYKIMDYAEVYRKTSNHIIHNPGQSVAFFKNYRMEFTRLPSSNTLENF